jgi:hypothetical protein
MGNKKYDPLIFGTVDIKDKVKVCGGMMYKHAHDIMTSQIILMCTTCGAIKRMSFISYHAPQQHICGATICQE